jgi:S-layer protein
MSLANYGASSITDNALATLILAGTGGGLTINDDLTPATPTPSTLNLTVNGLTDVTGITDTAAANAMISTLHVTTAGATASTLGHFIDTGLTTLNLDGTQALILTNIPTTGLIAINVSGGASLSSGAGLGFLLPTTTAFTSTSTGTDIVTIGATTKTVTGNGSANEELVWNGEAAPGSNASFGPVTGFKVLGVGSSASGTFDLAAITGFTAIDDQGNANFSITNATAGTPLTIDAGGGAVSYKTADTTGATDSLGLTLGTAATPIAAGTALTLGDSTTHGIGNLFVTSKASATGINTIALTDNNLSALTIAGTGAVAISNAVTDTATSLAVTNNSSATVASTVGGVIDILLTTLSFSGTGATTLNTLSSTSTNIAITDADTAAVAISTFADTALTSATFTNTVNTAAATFAVGAVATETNLATLNLNGNVGVNFTGDTVNAGITVSGATDNAAVSFASTGATAAAAADSVTLGNGVDTVALGAGLATSTQTVVLGTGAGDSVTTASVGTVNITEGSPAAGGDSATASGAGVNATIHMGDGNNTITANSAGDTLAITAGNGTNSISANGNGDTTTIAVGTGANTITLGANGTNNVTLGTHSATTGDTVNVVATLTAQFVPSAVLTGLNIAGLDTIKFLGDGGASGLSIFSPTQIHNIGAALGLGDPTTLAGTIFDVLSTAGGGGALAGRGVGEFQFQNNTYFVEQASTTAGTAFGTGDTLVEWTGAHTLTNTSNVTTGVLQLLG